FSFSFCSYRLSPPLRSTLFPYTTLFRSLKQIQVRIFLVESPDFFFVVEIIDGLFVAIAHLHKIARQLRRLLCPLRQETFEIAAIDRKSTRLNSSHLVISYAVFCLKKKKQ